MSTAAAMLRLKIESDLQHRYPSALTPPAKSIVETSSTKITVIDELLNGGFPVGAITELTGPASSGKTTIAQSFIAGHTNDGNFCAWVDTSDALDPESAAANGVSLNNLLWVRCSHSEQTNSTSQLHGSCQKVQSWTRLEQAIRATDQILHAGGYSVVVLDLADESVKSARRISLATWFRFRQAADRNRCCLLVLGKTSYAQSSAALVVQCFQDGPCSSFPNAIRGFKYGVKRERERSNSTTSMNRKPPVSAWTAPATWQFENHA